MMVSGLRSGRITWRRSRWKICAGVVGVHVGRFLAPRLDRLFRRMLRNQRQRSLADQILASVVEHADLVVDLRNAVRHRLGGGIAGPVPANVDVL